MTVVPKVERIVKHAPAPLRSHHAADVAKLPGAPPLRRRFTVGLAALYPILRRKSQKPLWPSHDQQTTFGPCQRQFVRDSG
jgi:hypothetical protein